MSYLDFLRQTEDEMPLRVLAGETALEFMRRALPIMAKRQDILRRQAVERQLRKENVDVLSVQR